MRTIALESLSMAVRSRVLKAIEEPVLLTDNGEPILVVRSLLDDDVADELIAQHPAFQASVERARQQKAAGQVKTLAELRQKYASE
jgi:hypothetical protein